MTAFLLLSCSVKPYKSPEMSSKLDSLSRLLNASSETSENIQAYPWRKVYTDPYLQGYIEQALAGNHDLLNAELNIQKAYANLRSARAALSPTFNVSVAAEGSAVRDQKFQGTVPAMGQANWELDIWGKLNSAKRAEKANIQSSINNMQAIQTSIISGVATAYYQLIAYDIQRNIILKTIDNRKQYLDTVTIMKKYARVNEVAVQQAVATLAEVRSQLPKVELAIIETENALSVLIGKPSSPGNFERSSQIDISNIEIFDKLPFGLLRNRPDVRAAEQSFRNAFELWNVSRAAMYPSLTLSVQGGFPDLVHSHMLILNSIAALTQPLWNSRKLRTDMEVKRLEKQKAENSFEKIVIQASAEVSNAYASMTKYHDISMNQLQKRDAYTKAYDYSYELFLNGYATYLDVLIAQEGVFNSEISLVDAYLKTITSQIELYRTLGGGADNEMVDKQAIEYAKSATKANKQ